MGYYSSVFCMFYIHLLILPLLYKSETIMQRLEQPLDHFNVMSIDKFNQTYYIIDDYWSKLPTSPVILHIGSTGFVDPVVVIRSGIIADVGKHFEALIVAVQSRFYGDSLNSEMLKLEKLPYLSIEQSLVDIAKIQKQVKRQYGVEKNPWIVMGASYGGLLSVFFRQKYSHLVTAAVASSAPVNMDNNGVLYFSSLAWSLKNESMGGSTQCFKQVSLAFDTFDGVLQLGNVQKLKKDFSLCDELVLTDKDRFAMAIDMSAMIVDVISHNELMHGMSIRQNLCPIFVKNSESYEALKELRGQYLRVKNQTCSNVSWESFIGPKYAFRDGIDDWDLYKQNPGERAWWWQVCAELGYVNYCDRNIGCPLSRFLDKNGYEAVCRDVFGIESGQTKKANDLFKLVYGGSRVGVGNVILTNGGADPWFSFGITVSDADRDVYAYVMPDVGHAADFCPAMRGQPESIATAKAFVIDKLDSLLATHKSNAKVLTCVTTKNILTLIIFYILLN